MSDETTAEDPTLGEIYWDAWGDGAARKIPYSDLADAYREHTERAAAAVGAAAIARLGTPAELTAAGRAVAEPKRYALVEQMGHRSTVGTVTETTFCGRPMLELTALDTGRAHLVAPESLYEITWLTEAEARQRAKPWTAVALPAAPHDSWDDRDDADRRGNGEDDSAPGDDL
jgi:hypothetical protein